MDNEKINKEVEKHINNIIDEGIQANNIEMLGMLVDVHKDLANEDYWKNKEEVMEMNYRTGRSGYGTYDRDEYGARTRDSRGRYSARGRGRGNYRGEEMLEEMMEHYDNYMDGASYGGPETDKAFEYMLQAAEDFMCHLMEESDSPEKMEKVRRLARKISEMR